MASTTTLQIQSGLQQQAQQVAGQAPVVVQVPQQQSLHRILRIAVNGTINDPKTVWTFTTANGTKTFACCELMVMSPSITTFHGRTTLDVPITIETLNAVCATDFTGDQAFFFVVRIHSHYVLLQPPRFLCSNVGSTAETSTIRAAARYLGEDLLWFAFKSYSGALEGGITQIYRSQESNTTLEVHQSNKKLVKLISSAGTLVDYTGGIDPAFFVPPPYVAATPVQKQLPTMSLQSAADALAMPPPSTLPLANIAARKQRALSNKERRAASIVVDATVAAAKVARRVKKVHQFSAGANKTATAQQMMLANRMPLDLAINSAIVKSICGVPNPTCVTFNLSLSGDECREYAEMLLMPDATTYVENERLEVRFSDVDTVEFDLRGLQTPAGGVLVSVPASWVPDNVQREIERMPMTKKAVEIEMLRVLRAHIATRFSMAPEYYTSLEKVYSESPPQLNYTTFDKKVIVELRDSSLRGADGASETIRNRNLIAATPIEAQQNFMICREGRFVQISDIIGMQLGTMLLGVSKVDALPTNFSSWWLEGNDYLVQFGAVNDTTLEDGSLMVFVGQCGANMQPNARLEVTSITDDGDKRPTMCLKALTNIAAGATICIDRGAGFVNQLYPLLTGQSVPTVGASESPTSSAPTSSQHQQTSNTIASTSSSSSVDSPLQQPASTFFSALGEVASQQFEEEEVILQSANCATAAIAKIDDDSVLANNLDDDDDDNDNHETIEASMRSESARLASLSVIQEDLEQSSILHSASFRSSFAKTTGNKRQFEFATNNNDNDDAMSSTGKRFKQSKSYFMLSQPSQKSQTTVTAGTPTKRKFKSLFSRNDTDSIEVSVVLP